MFAIIDESLKESHPQMVQEATEFVGDANILYSFLYSLQTDLLGSIPEGEVIFLIGVAQRYENVSLFCEENRFRLLEISPRDNNPGRSNGVIVPPRVICPGYQNIIVEMKKFLHQEEGQ